MTGHNIPTAEEFILKKNPLNSHKIKFQKERLIEFAKLHVEAALKAASEKAETKIDENWSSPGDFEIDESSILNAYPLENIK